MIATATRFDLLLTGMAWWMLIPLAGILGFAAVRLYRRETEKLQKGGAALRALRAAVIVLLVLLLSQPVFYRSYALFEPPAVIVLRDVSASMHVKDVHLPLERRVREAVKLGLLDERLRQTQGEDVARTFTQASQSAGTLAFRLNVNLERLPERRYASSFPLRLSGSLERELGLLQEAVAKAHALLAPILDEHDVFLEMISVLSGEVDAIVKRFAMEGRNPVISKVDLKEVMRKLKRIDKKSIELKTIALKLQDTFDRDLGAREDPAVVQALAELSRMDRSARVSAMFEHGLDEALRKKMRVIAYDFDTGLKSSFGTNRSPGSRSEAEDEDGGSAQTSTTPVRRIRKRDETDLATPLLRLTQRHAQQRIAAVVLCSDGRHTSGPDPTEAARIMSARGIPVYTLGVGGIESPPDICVARLEGTLSVFKDETIRLTAAIKATGMKGRKGQLILRRTDEVLQERVITFGADGWRHEVFELAARKSGPNIFSVELKPLAQEALKTNNRAQAVVDVAGDRLRALVVDELPRWETRYVANLLRRERKMILEERWLATNKTLSFSAPALPGTKGALESFDIIVLGDVAPVRLPESDQKRLANYVSERGGFLVLISGPNAMPREYAGGPVADMLPITQQSSNVAVAPMAPLAPSSSSKANRIRLQLDPAALDHEIMRVFRDPRLNEKLWPSLPELRWVFRPAYGKPGAMALLRTGDARKDLVVGVHHYGSGRVLYVGTDETWRWRYKMGDRVHAFFWSQAFRWGTSNRLQGGPRLKAALTRRQVRPGDDLEVLARPRDPNGKSVTDAAVVAELAGKSQRQRVRLISVPGSGGLYRGELKKIGAGVHEIRVFVESPGFEGAAVKMEAIAREESGQEGVELGRDTQRLVAMAKAGKARYLDLIDARQLFDELSAKGRERQVESTYELWSSYPAMLLIVLLLVAEWTLRKRVGLA